MRFRICIVMAKHQKGPIFSLYGENLPRAAAEKKREIPPLIKIPPLIREGSANKGGGIFINLRPVGPKIFEV